MGGSQKHIKNPINLTMRSKFKVVSGSWMYATHCLMVIHPCATYGKPMSNQKKCYGLDTDRPTEGQADGQIEWFLYTPLNFVHGGYNYPLQLKMGMSFYLSGVPPGRPLTTTDCMKGVDRLVQCGVRDSQGRLSPKSWTMSKKLDSVSIWIGRVVLKDPIYKTCGK